MKNKLARSLFLWALIILSIYILSRLKLSVPLYDYVSYWSAGRLNLQGNNPYDPSLLLDLQREVGWTLEFPIPTWYPPWALCLLMPFSLLDYSLSRFLWFLASVIILVYAIKQSWELYGGASKTIWLGLILGLLFSPTLLALLLGQASPWILLGVVGFLVFVTKNKSPWIIGAWTGLISIKPQLLFLFWIVLVLWSVYQRKWQVLAGSMISIFTGLIVASLFNPGLLVDYIKSLSITPPSFFATPTIGYFLRALFGYKNFWLQFIPPLIGTLWMIVYWNKRKIQWDWLQEMPIVMFVSLITSPFAWNHDQIVLIPFLMQAILIMLSSQKRWKMILIFVIFIMINYANLWVHQRLDETWAIWMAPALFGLYGYIRQEQAQNQTALEMAHS